MSDADLRLDVFKLSRTYAICFAQLVDGGKAAASGTELHDSPCQDLPHPGELLQLVGGGGVQVQDGGGRVENRGTGSCGCAGQGGAYHDLLAVDQASCRVECAR